MTMIESNLWLINVDDTADDEEAMTPTVQEET